MAKGTTSQSAPGALLDAHYTFLQDVTAASTDLQQRVQALQLEYQSACLRASQSQQPEDTQAATEAWQQLMQPISADPDLQARTREAYGKYLSAVGAMLSAGDADALDPSTLAAVSQSMATVAACASQLSTAASPSPGTDTA
jgi:hypothetical protein